MNRTCKYLISTFLVTISVLSAVVAQTTDKKAEQQRRIIAELERNIAKEEQQLSTLKKDKASTQKKVKLLTAQIEKRNSLIIATGQQIKELSNEVEQSTLRIDSLSRQLNALENSCREMARTAYRNYRFHNYMAYIFSSKSFDDMTGRIAALRTATERRGEKMKEIASLRDNIRNEREHLESKRDALNASKQKLDNQRARMRRDAKDAQQTINSMSKREKAVLKAKLEQEAKLDEAIRELYKLTKGNKTGASFSSKTSNLHLPVVGGKVKRYNGNMAQITGEEGAKIISIYEGKVVDVKRNKVTNKYDVYIAHGEYITSYANLSAVNVTKGQTVKGDQKIGTIGSAVDPSTMEIEYKLVFGIYAPSPNIKMSVANCFKKR